MNVLVRAHRPDLPDAGATGRWLEDALSADEPVATWDSLLVSTYRILTLPRLVREANAAALAMRFLQEVRDASVHVRPGDRHWASVRDLIESTHASGNLVTDASIAAVAMANDCRLATFDLDFARFPGLRWFQPAT